MLSPDLPDDFFKLSLNDPKLVFPTNATEADKRELEENCTLAGPICTFLMDSLRYGFANPIISKQLFIALHIYGGRDTIIAYYPSQLLNERIIVRVGNTDRYFLLDCRTGLLGSLDRRIGRDDRIVMEGGQLAIRDVHDISPTQPRKEVVPVLILIKKELSDQYIVRKGADVKQTFVVIITQSDHPDRMVIRV